MTSQEAYLILQAAFNAQPGDTVKVLRKSESDEYGWLGSWNPLKDRCVDALGVVKQANREGVFIAFSDHNVWYLPWHVLEVVKKAPDPLYRIIFEKGKPWEIVMTNTLSHNDYTKIHELLGIETKLMEPPEIPSRAKQVEAYKLLAKEIDWQPGDKLRLTRDYEQRELGSDWVGKKKGGLHDNMAFVELAGDGSCDVVCKVDDKNTNSRYLFPWWALEKIADAEKTHTLVLDGKEMTISHESFLEMKKGFK